ncbi:MAG: hypothetical protein IPN70_04630 [Candidatus Moraniibacteriota bacterium]|nr:MAG: hypothetical protein IPN70_04630 [Candidatus Moranbacteria bacterium]
MKKTVFLSLFVLLFLFGNAYSYEEKISCIEDFKLDSTESMISERFPEYLYECLREIDREIKKTKDLSIILMRDYDEAERMWMRASQQHASVSEYSPFKYIYSVNEASNKKILEAVKEKFSANRLQENNLLAQKERLLQLVPLYDEILEKSENSSPK